MRSIVVCLAFGFAAIVSSAAPILTWGDQGDGTYRNPVLYADYSDPDAIRADDDFYLVASDFHFMGIQVLHSRDLVNWRIVGQVFHRLTVDPKYDEMRGYGEGTWAPTLRYHDGVFYLFVCTPHDGLFMWHTKDPAGPWSDVVTVRRVDAWEDPCPFWDEDGRAYLVHGRKGAGPLILHRMKPDGTQLLDDGVEIYHGPVAEGPKLFKRHGWYYISLPEGGVSTGGQTILRSHTLSGPYERRQVLVDGSPHQGALVELPNGETWFLAFKSTAQSGRVTHLIPVRWGADDWPVFGDDGHAPEHAKKPDLPSTSVEKPQTSDEFASSSLSPQWQWNHNPVETAWSLTARPGWLRLHGLPAAELELAHNTLTQKLWGERGSLLAKLDVAHLGDRQRAGVTFMSGHTFGPISLRRDGQGVRVEAGGAMASVDAPVVWLRATYHGASGRLAFSTDGANFLDLGTEVPLKFGDWKGARVGLFCYGGGEGYVDVDEVRYVCEDVK